MSCSFGSGKSCSFSLLHVPFINCCQFMYLVISLLVLRAGCGIWLYQFLIIPYLFTLLKTEHARQKTTFSPLQVNGKDFRKSKANYSEGNSQTKPDLQLDRDFILVLITYKFDEDLSPDRAARLKSRFSFLKHFRILYAFIPNTIQLNQRLCKNLHCKNLTQKNSVCDLDPKVI